VRSRDKKKMTNDRHAARGKLRTTPYRCRRVVNKERGDGKVILQRHARQKPMKREWTKEGPTKKETDRMQLGKGKKGWGK